jgi:hypothetical protein
MTPTEAAKLCAFAGQCFPQQKINEFTPDAWGLILEDIRFDDAHEALVRLARKQPFVSPAEIIREVKKIRAKRIDEYGPITPPADLDPDDTAAYREWWANVQKAIADGEMRPKELDLPKRDMRQIERTFRRPA